MYQSKLFRNHSENLKYIQKSLQNHLAGLPEGSLRIYHRISNGRNYSYFLYITPDGKRKYIKANPALVRVLSLKLFLEQVLLRVETAISASDTAAEASEALNTAAVINELPPEILPFLSIDPVSNDISPFTNLTEQQLSEWKETTYPPNGPYFNERKHRTSDGTLVKSKGELIIYEKLLQYKITFKYEQPLRINNTTYYPDFTILLPDGRIIYWEHAGLMNNIKYRLRHKKKLEAYESVDIVPWKKNRRDLSISPALLISLFHFYSCRYCF